MTKFTSCATAGLTVLLPMVAAGAADFDGDDFADLATGVDGEDLGSIKNAGAAHVLYGSQPAGLAAAGNQFWTQDTAGIQDSAKTDDTLGVSPVGGDFNGDEIDDLAIASLEGLGTGSPAVVHVRLGSPAGVVATGNQLWTQNSLNILDTAELGDKFGGRP